MNKQELLECIAPYLPYNVQVACDNIYEGFKCELVIRNSTNSLKNGMDINECVINDAKLILRPISDLTKPCLEGGKITIVELVKNTAKVDEIVEFKQNRHFIGVMFKSGDYNSRFMYYKGNREFKLFTEKGNRLPVRQLMLLNMMFKFHFDVYDLIGNYAIDINTLNVE